MAVTAEAHHYDELHRLVDRLEPNQAEAVRAVVLQFVAAVEHTGAWAGDIDDGVADETVSFALDGVSYEVDLSNEDAARLRHALSEFVTNAQRIGDHERPRQFSFAGSLSAESDFAERSEEILEDMARRNTA